MFTAFSYKIFVHKCTKIFNRIFLFFSTLSKILRPIVLIERIYHLLLNVDLVLVSTFRESLLARKNSSMRSKHEFSIMKKDLSLQEKNYMIGSICCTAFWRTSQELKMATSLIWSSDWLQILWVPCNLFYHQNSKLLLLAE